jgi:hypothetical protein
MTAVTPPTPTPVPIIDPVAQTVVNDLQDVISDAADAAKTAIISASPFMGTPVIKQIWEGIFDLVVSKLMNPLVTLSGRVVISLEEYKNLKAVVAAQAALDAAKQTGDSSAITQASQKVDSTAAAAIQYVGGVTTT